MNSQTLLRQAVLLKPTTLRRIQTVACADAEGAFFLLGKISFVAVPYSTSCSLKNIWVDSTFDYHK